jgi:aryl-alcohol dehydrogenase-like predicted oxidoreductase
VEILKWCIERGINFIDTATAYQWNWTYDGNIGEDNFRHLTDEFNINVKVQLGDDREQIDIYDNVSIMAHNAEYYYAMLSVQSLSVYGPDDWIYLFPRRPKIVQLPYSLFDRRWEPLMPKLKSWGTEIHVRSVFLRGKILDKTTPQECIKFVLSNPHVDKVILGVDSLDQLKENLSFIEEWNALEEKDLDIIDPRRWNE